MSSYLDHEDLKQLISPEYAFRSPIPTQLVSNEEMVPPPQGVKQREVESRIRTSADRLAAASGLSRRQFLRTNAGMASAFIAMNGVHGALFGVTEAEAADMSIADARAKELSKQFIFDPHTHYIRDDAAGDGVLARFANLRNLAGKKGWNSSLATKLQTVEDLKLATFVKEIYLDSDTKVALLSGAPADEEKEWFLTNAQIAATRDAINRFSGSQRMLSHFIIAPKQPGWLDALDQGLVELNPSGIKGYTIGDNNRKDTSRYPWRLDDEKLMYPAYERMVKAGVRNFAVHKGLFTNNDLKRFPNLAEFAGVGDLGKAAKDWPQLNFIIYHSAFRLVGEGENDIAWQQFSKTGRMDWISDLAEIPEKYGVKNVYGEIGVVFGGAVISEPRVAAAMLGILIKGLGVDHVLWGTDSIWYGSPQWQIEALRRLEIPEEMRRRYGFTALGQPDGEIKRAIFGLNGARLFGLDPSSRSYLSDNMRRAQKVYATSGAGRSNRVYGKIRHPSSGIVT